MIGVVKCVLSCMARVRMIVTGENDLSFNSEVGKMWVSHRRWLLFCGGGVRGVNSFDKYEMPAG